MADTTRKTASEPPPTTTPLPPPDGAAEPPPFDALEARAFSLGRALVADHGVRLAGLLFDADEVLWDWLMDLSEMVRRPRWRWGQGGWDVGHREWVQVRPGMLGLLWGLHVECRAQGHDPRLRIWTNGYPYRLHAILEGAPALWPLLGLPDRREETLAGAPTLVFRSHYSEAVAALLCPARRAAFLTEASPETRQAVARHLRRHPFDPNLKLPALAALVGKTGLAEARVLVDDTLGNVVRFARAGGRGVHIAAPAPTVLRGRVPNTVWRAPGRALPRLAADLTPELGEALRRLCAPGEPSVPDGLRWIRIQRWEAPAASRNGASRHAPGATSDVTTGAARPFVIRIPDDRVRDQWIAPREALRRLLARPDTRATLADALCPEATP